MSNLTSVIESDDNMSSATASGLHTDKSSAGPSHNSEPTGSAKKKKCAPKRGHHVSLSIKQKLEILDKIEKGVKVHVIQKQYNIGSSTVYDMKRDKVKIRAYGHRPEIEDATLNKKRRIVDGKVRTVDTSVYEWYKQQLSVGVPVRGIEIQAVAEKFAKLLKKTDFIASNGWLWRFRCRHGIVNRQVSGEAMAAAKHGEDRKYDFGSLSSSSGGGAPFAPGLNENSTESGEGAAGGGGGGGGGGGACEEGPVPMSPEQFLCEDMEHAGGASPHTPSSSSHQRPESYKLRHNNHLTLVLESLAGDESFMDVTLTAQGKAIKAHKSVLSAVSPYFRSVLKENPCQHPIIIMPRDIRFEELNNIISYVYKGEMTVAAEDLSSMLKTAEVLQVTGLSPSEAGSGAGGIMSHMQGLPAGVFGAGAAPPAKAKKAKHVHTQQHQVVAHEEEPHAANNHDIRGRIDPLDFLNADMTCVKEEIPSDTEETEDMGFTLPDDSSGPASKVTEPLPAAASFSSDPSTTRHPSNRRKSLDSPRPMDDPSNKPFNPGEPGPSPTEPQAAAAATPSPSSTPPPPHVCPHCLETHRPTDALHSHLRLKHPSKPSFVCASCGKVFLRHSLFAEHSKKCKV